MTRRENQPLGIANRAEETGKDHADFVAPYHLARLREGLAPFRLHFIARVGSTSDRAAGLRRAGKLFAPAVVLAGRQTSGRGRNGNSWFSCAGSITATFALPIDQGLPPHHLPLIAGLAARNAVARCLGDDGVQLKWPNDLLYGGRKLGGLLCERIEKADLIGIGLNVNLEPARAPLALRQRIASMSDIAGRAFDRNEVLIATAGELRSVLRRAAELPFSEILREYDAHHALIGRSVTVVGQDGEPPISGRVEGLDDVGRLLLRDRGRLHRIIAGQVNGAF